MAYAHSLRAHARRARANLSDGAPTKVNAKVQVVVGGLDGLEVGPRVRVVAETLRHACLKGAHCHVT